MRITCWRCRCKIALGSYNGIFIGIKRNCQFPSNSLEKIVENGVVLVHRGGTNEVVGSDRGRYLQ